VGPRIAIVGGGSHQWAPTLVTDIAGRAALQDAHIVLEDIDASRLPRMREYVEHVARVRRIPMTVSTTTDQRAALDGADYVVVNISTGGFASMRHDLEIPARHGIQQPVGDTVGPGGVSRALRNIPVLLGIARDIEELCPHAWLLNLTNPMTTLCRAVTRETAVRTVGLCHEITITRFYLSLLLDADFRAIEPVITGVNHLPVITELRIDGDPGGDGLARLADLTADNRRRDEPLPFALPDDLGHEPRPDGAEWRKGDLLDINRVKLELFQRFGALPGAGDRHVVEFFPGFVTEESAWGKRWGVTLTSIEDRERDEERYVQRLEERLARDDVPDDPSGEMVAPLIDSFITGKARSLPLNLPNAGQCPDLPPDVVVEAMCIADGEGVRGRDRASAPPFLAEHLRRVSAAQELTVDAALSGRRDDVLAALLADPLTGRSDYERVEQMADELLAATRPWLPQFA
jgi:alpha-galactosidase